MQSLWHHHRFEQWLLMLDLGVVGPPEPQENHFEAIKAPEIHLKCAMHSSISQHRNIPVYFRVSQIRDICKSFPMMNLLSQGKSILLLFFFFFFL